MNLGRTLRLSSLVQRSVYYRRVIFPLYHRTQNPLLNISPRITYLRVVLRILSLLLPGKILLLITIILRLLRYLVITHLTIQRNHARVTLYPTHRISEAAQLLAGLILLVLLLQLKILLLRLLIIWRIYFTLHQVIA